MSKDEIEKAVREIVETTVGNQDVIRASEIIISDESNLRQDLGLDSLALAELAVRIETKFDLDVFEDSVPKTVREIIDRLT